MGKITNVAITVLSIGLGLSMLIDSQITLLDPVRFLSIFLGCVLALVFLNRIKKKPKQWPVQLTLFLLAVIATGYMFVFTDELQLRAAWPTTVDIIISFLLVFLGIEATRQSLGIVLPIIGVIIIAYIFLGHYLPYPLECPEFSLSDIASRLAVGFSGVYGEALRTAANYIFLFVLLGELMRVFGAFPFFMELGKLAGKVLAGGPAMTSVISSALVGMITGSPMANVVITGTFTIPLMKKVGFTPEFAGAVEAAASTGGAIMPPIMGVAAFLMAGIVGVPYLTICKMAIIPAILYFFCIGISVQLCAKKLNIHPPPEKVNYREFLLRSPLFLVPVLTLICLLTTGYSPPFAAFWAIILLFAVVFLIRKEIRRDAAVWIEGFSSGALTGAGIAVACTVIGIIIDGVAMTGLGIKVPGLVEMWSGGNMVIALIMTWVAAVLLGCGMPIMVAYVVVAMLVAPALNVLGLDLLQSHFFVFIAACFSAITPPVAVAAIPAAAIARASYTKVAINATRLGMVAFFLPFLIIWCPVLIMEPELGLLLETLVVLAVVFGIISMSIVNIGYLLTSLNAWERVIWFMAAVGFWGFAFIKLYPFLIFAVILSILLTIWNVIGLNRLKNKVFQTV